MCCNISDEIIKNTTKCPNDFKCLEDENFKTCPAVDFIETDNILFVNAKFYVVCPYILPFADSNICSCPVRIDIFKKCRSKEN